MCRRWSQGGSRDSWLYKSLRPTLNSGGGMKLELLAVCKICKRNREQERCVPEREAFLPFLHLHITLILRLAELLEPQQISCQGCFLIKLIILGTVRGWINLGSCSGQVRLMV